MAKLLRLRRGTDTQHTTFTGAEGEVTVNTTNDSLHVHDGTTAGGTELAKADLSNVDGSLSNNLGFGDNVKATFGASNDLEIYHDGTDSVIRDDSRNLLIRADGATGDLYLQSDNQVILSDVGGNETFIECNDNSDVKLYHDNNVKLATTSTGIDVTGTVTCDGVSSEGLIIAQGNAEFQVRVKDGNSTGSAAETGIQFVDSANTQQAHIGCIANGNLDLYVGTQTNGSITFQTNGTNRLFIANDGASVYPAVTNSTDIGTSTNQWRNAYFDGTVNCDGLSVIGGSDSVFEDSTVYVRRTSGYASIEVGGPSGAFIDLKGPNSDDFDLRLLTGGTGGEINVNGNNLSLNGHFVPSNNNNWDLGTSSLRWRNVYTNDLNLSNEGGTNDVDGTWGSWTIQEGEDDLFLLNRRNGKKYKFNLSEVN